MINIVRMSKTIMMIKMNKKKESLTTNIWMNLTARIMTQIHGIKSMI
jgi:hypothetical protein